MEVGFIGAGNVTRTIGRHLINAGHTVVASNSRGPETLSEFVADLGPSACAGTKQQSAECDMVILATRWVNVPEALTGIDWQGRILVDATNAHMDSEPDLSLAGVARSRAALKGRTSSEIVAEMAIGSRLVKSISNIPMSWIQDFSPNKPRTVLFTSGDESEAKQCVIELINSTGLVAIDLGSLRMGGAMHEIGAPLSGIEFHFVQRLRRRREWRESMKTKTSDSVTISDLDQPSYFKTRKIMKTQHFFIDLTQRPPRSFRVRLGNYVVLARMLDKGRATLAGKNGDYHYNSSTDQRLVQFLGFDPDALLKELATGKARRGNPRMGSGPFQDPALSMGNRGLVCFHGKTRAGQRRRNTCVLC